MHRIISTNNAASSSQRQITGGEIAGQIANGNKFFGIVKV